MYGFSFSWRTEKFKRIEQVNTSVGSEYGEESIYFIKFLKIQTTDFAWK